MSKDKGGRPTKYKEEYNEQVFKYALLGCDDATIANLLNIDVATLNRWKIEKDGFCESINNGKFKADAEIAASLYHKGKGMTITEVKTTVFKNGTEDEEDKAEGNTVVVTTKKQLAPDTKAAQIWLTNRQRAYFKQNPDNFNDDGTDKQNNIVLNIGGIINPLPNKEDEIEDFTKDE